MHCVLLVTCLAILTRVTTSFEYNDDDDDGGDENHLASQSGEYDAIS